jgi:hypothetical protein
MVPDPWRYYLRGINTIELMESENMGEEVITG